MSIFTKVAIVANKVSLKAAERSTNAKISELEDNGYVIKGIQTSAHPVPDENNQGVLRLLWLSLITYQVDEVKTKNQPDVVLKSAERLVVLDPEDAE